jgi:FKBP-type peptidyl-prolyl cis-trans isomerase FkpA
MRWVLCAAVGLLTGCIDPLTAPPCTAVEFTNASLSGDTITTTTGLRYINGAPGTRDTLPDGTPGTRDTLPWCRTVAVHYEAFLLDGTKFDSSRDRSQPLVFTAGFGALIDGIEQGVIGMRAEGTRRLIIPPALGFGSEPRRNEAGEIVVPGNSTVVYDIEVLEISP